VYNSRDPDVKKVDAILCRTNAGAAACILEKANAGISFRASIDMKDIKDVLSAIKMLHMDANHTHHLTPVGVKTFNDLRNMSDAGVLSDAFKFVLNMYITSGYSVTKARIDAIASVAKTKDGEGVLITTVHKVKGEEYDSVELYSDFSLHGSSKWTPEEGRILYVAVTRAKHSLFMNTEMLSNIGIEDVSGTASSGSRLDKLLFLHG
jgi:superfamily I DNA/RNA helicase